MTRSSIKHWFFGLLVIGCPPAWLYAQDATPLEPGKAMEGEIAVSQTHTYRITLQAGQFVHFTVEQLSCDVTVTITTPDGKTSVKANLGVAGLREELSEEATMSGEYQLTLRNTSSPWLKGNYRLQADVKATATANDRKRVQAERGLIEHDAISNPQQALEKLAPLLALWRDIGDRHWEGVTIGALAARYQQQQNWAKAVEHAEQAVAIMREVKMPVAEAWYLQTLAICQRSQQQIDKAIANATQGLSLARATKQRNLEANLLGLLGDIAFFNKSEPEKAAAYYDQSIAIYQELGNVPGLAARYNVQGMVAQQLKKYEEAEQRYQTALTMAREKNAKSLEAFILRNLADLYRAQNQTEKVADRYEQSLQLSRELKDQVSEATTLLNYSSFLRASQQYEKSLQGYTRVLAIRRALKDRSGEGIALVRIAAITFEHFNRLEDVAENYEKALLISAETKNTNLEAALLNSIPAKTRLHNTPEEKEAVFRQFENLVNIARTRNYKRTEALMLLQIGNPNRYLLTTQQAIPYLENALSLAQQNQNRSLVIDALNFLSEAYSSMMDFEKSVTFTKQSVELARSSNDFEGEVIALGVLAAFYSLLGQNEQASVAFEQSLSTAEKYKKDLTRVLYAYGGHLSGIGLHEKAILFHERALAIMQARKEKDIYWEANQLSALGANYIRLKQFEKALEYLQQALQKAQEKAALDLMPGILSRFGDAYRGQQKYELALNFHQQALLKSNPQNLLLLSQRYNDLMQDSLALKLPAIAIFWGKQSINTLQAIRGRLTQLDEDLQRSFLKSKEQTYRELADLLIANGRLPEAEQVIRMLKDEEYFDYIRRDTKNGPKGEKASLTPEELAAEKRYREIADQLAGIGAERSALLSKNERSAEEEQRLAKLETDLTVASQVFQKFLDQLSTELSTRKAGDASVAQLNDSQAFMDDLREMGKGAVALYTVVSEDKFHVILTTPDLRKSYSYPIKVADLNRKVLAFRDVLQNPKLDPLPLAQELYKILVAPLAKDLQAAKAETLMWSLDGVLRYVPMAALHDGEKYLVERWRNVVFTAASKGRLKDDPSRNWRALGLGVTKAHGERIPALPAVADEMRGIIRETGSKTGVLPGAIKLDEQFTEEAMKAGLRTKPTVVHVASHFQFQPGNETNSALLLGDGKFLSLAQIKSLPNVFGGVELLTLSACNTALGSGGSSSATGKEIEGFGMLAQNQGAKAVVASLWPVADRSTKELMREFYSLREAKTDMTKAEALRWAQSKLLRGELQAMGETMAAREIVHEINQTASQPMYKPDPKKPYAHPYYWAPFILIGNWK